MAFGVDEGQIACEAPPVVEEQGEIQRSEEAVMAALGDEKFDFRSVRGLSDCLGIEPSVVEAILKKHADEIRVSAVPDALGETLYTLRARPRTLQERVSEAFTFIAGAGAAR